MKAIQYAFHPVGQGLFATGTIFQKGEKDVTKGISWIYDCGSSSNHSKNFFEQVIKSANYLCGMNGEVDFLVISHFDKDHFNGIQYLASGGIKKIKTIFIPYMPVWQRLLTYISKNEYYNSEYFEFIVNPLTKLREYFGKVKIVIVDYSDGQEDGFVNLNFEQYNDYAISLVRNFIIDDLDNLREYSVNVHTVKNKYLIDTSDCEDAKWKFSFYNIPNKNSDYFYRNYKNKIENTIENIQQDIINNEKNENTRRSIDLLAKIYKEGVGKKSNDTSLVMLVQSINQHRFCINEQKINDIFDCYEKIDHSINYDLCYCHTPKIHNRIRKPKKYQFKCNNFSATYFYDNLRILFTGDINVSSKKRMNHMLEYLKIKDTSIATLQVMHHGSGKYFHPSLPQAVSPHCSIFCADPNFKYNHPARDTLLQFIEYNPIIVNDIGVLFTAYIQ